MTNVPEKQTSISIVSTANDTNVFEPKNTTSDTKTARKNVAEIWHDFNERTTFHGYRYIFGREGNVLRRLVWLAFLIVCTILLIIQAKDRIQYYYSWPVTVNYRVEYMDIMAFPAVTICNQNSFRLSEVHSKNQSHLIDQYLEHEIDNTHNPSDITIKSLEWDNAHQANDLIVSCTWQGMPCSNNFTASHLEYGVCYTFNGKNSSNQLMTTRSGSGNALELILNSETYNYMAGFNIGTGIKLAVHDRNIYPSVTEAGHAISTGTYAILGVQIKVINNLEPPHGQCEHVRLHYFDYDYTIAACKLECQLTAVLDECRCIMPYMPHIDTVEDLPECQLYEHMECITRVQDDRVNYSEIGAFYALTGSGNMTSGTCKCPSPCEDITFESSISYASLSEYAIHQLEDFDAKLYEKKLARTVQIRNDLAGEEDYLRKISTFWIDTLSCYEDNEDLFSQLIFYYRNLTDNITNACTQSMDYYNNKMIETGNIYNNEVILEEISRYLFIITFDFRSHVILLLQTLSSADNSTDIYLTISTNAIVSRRHLVSNMHNTTNTFLNRCVNNEVCNDSVMSTIQHFENMTQCLDTLLQISNDIYSGVNTFDMKLVERLLQSFEQSSSEIGYEVVRLFDGIRDVFEQQKKQYFDIEEFCTDIQDISSYIETDIANLETEQYYLEVASIPDFKRFNDVIATFIIDRYSDEMTENYIQDAIIWQLLYMDWDFNQLMFVMPYLSSLDKLRNKIYRSFNRHRDREYNKADFKYIYHEMVTSDYRVRHPDDHVRQMEKWYKRSQQQIVDIHSSISDNKIRTTVDSTFYRNNFIHLSVSMKELSYTKITQQEAYRIFALMSDIGGLMGLFIGGSVVSILELIDFLVDLSYMIVKK